MLYRAFIVLRACAQKSRLFERPPNDRKTHSPHSITSSTDARRTCPPVRLGGRPQNTMQIAAIVYQKLSNSSLSPSCALSARLAQPALSPVRRRVRVTRLRGRRSNLPRAQLRLIRTGCGGASSGGQRHFFRVLGGVNRQMRRKGVRSGYGRAADAISNRPPKMIISGGRTRARRALGTPVAHGQLTSLRLTTLRHVTLCWRDG